MVCVDGLNSDFGKSMNCLRTLLEDLGLKGEITVKLCESLVSIDCLKRVQVLLGSFGCPGLYIFFIISLY